MPTYYYEVISIEGDYANLKYELMQYEMVDRP